MSSWRPGLEHPDGARRREAESRPGDAGPRASGAGREAASRLAPLSRAGRGFWGRWQGARVRARDTHAECVGTLVPDITYGFSCSVRTLLCLPKPQAPCCLMALGQESPGKEKGPEVWVARTSGPTTPHSLPLGGLGGMWGWGAQRPQGWGQEPETGCAKSDKLLSQSRVACPETLHRQTRCWVRAQFWGQKGARGYGRSDANIHLVGTSVSWAGFAAINLLFQGQRK